MKNQDFNITIASDGRYEPVRLVAEIDYKGQEFAYVEEINGQLMVSIYPNIDKKHWLIDYEMLINVFKMAKEALQ